MNEAVLTTIAVLSWVVAPTGLVVTTILLWQNVLKVRQAHLQIKEGKLKIRQLEDLLETAEERIYRPTSEEVKEVLTEHRDFLRSERESIERLRSSGSAKPTRSVIISLLLVALCSLPMLGILSHVTNRANYAAGAVSEQSTTVSSLESQLSRMDTEIRHLRVKLEALDANAETADKELKKSLHRLQQQRETLRFILDWIEGDKRTEGDAGFERSTNRGELEGLRRKLFEVERPE